MSYLLEALKKSDKERKDGKIPDLRTDHSRPQERRRKVSVTVYWLLGFVVCVLFCGSVWLFWRTTIADTGLIASPQKDETVVVHEKSVSATENIPKPGEGKPIQAVQTESGSDSVVSPQKPSAIEGEYSLPRREPVETVFAKIPLFDELPVTVRAGIPSLSFAGHVYSDQPRKRLIIINNRIVREKDRIENDLVLEEITAEGVVLRYQDTAFQVLLF